MYAYILKLKNNSPDNAFPLVRLPDYIWESLMSEEIFQVFYLFYIRRKIEFTTQLGDTTRSDIS